MSNNRIKRTKKQIYEIDRNNMLNEINTIINFDENNGEFFIVDLKNNTDLINKLNELANDKIKKWYNCSTWGWYMNKYNNKEHDEVVLLKSIYKSHDYNIYSKSITTEKKGIKKRYTKLFIKK